MIVGYLFLFFFNLILMSFGFDLFEVIDIFVVLFFFLVLLSFVYVILCYCFWDIGIILCDVVVYMLIFLFGVFGFLLLNLFI